MRALASHAAGAGRVISYAVSAVATLALSSHTTSSSSRAGRIKAHVVRSGRFGAVFLLSAIRLALQCAIRDRQHWMLLTGEAIAALCESLGGAWVKVAQLLSTRHDLLPPALLEPLGRLQERGRPDDLEDVEAALVEAFGGPMDEVFSHFDPVAVATGTIAQVHRARLRKDGKEVAVKVRRRRVRAAFEADLGLLAAGVRMAGRLGIGRGLPMEEAVRQVSTALHQQVDFRHEAEHNRCFQRIFAESENLRLPRLVDAWCGEAVLVMEFFQGLQRFDDSALDEATRRRAVRIGLTALYRMIFGAGLIHCDLHPGNIQLLPSGCVALMDTGFVARLAPMQLDSFREFFLSIAGGDGETAAAVLLRTAQRVPKGLNETRYRAEVGALVERASRLRAGEFQVAAFVGGLFSIQRCHGVLGSPDFTLAILSLLVYEGMIKQWAADLDFQREAIPFLMQALLGR